MEPTRRAHFKLTDRGLNALSSGTKVNNEYLSQFPEFTQFKSRSRQDGDKPAQTKVVAILDPALEQSTPDEVMRAAHMQIEAQLKSDLLDRILDAPPAFFERVIVSLLVAMGYGGSAENAGRALGRSGDGGVDGVIDQDALGLDRVYVQAKRYSKDNSVGASAVRDFFGSLDRYKAAKGVFVTTSGFTRDSEETAGFLSKRIVLVDGERLADLLMRHNVGVRTEETLELKKVDEDFFSE